MLEDYLAELEEKVSRYEGDYQPQIAAAPHLLGLLNNLLSYEGLSPEHGDLIRSAIAYFVSPFDVISEAIYGYMGFMDDLYVASYTLRKVLDDLPIAVVEEYWGGDGDLRSFVDEVFETSAGLMGSKTGEILAHLGVE